VKGEGEKGGVKRKEVHDNSEEKGRRKNVLPSRRRGGEG